MSRLSEGQDPVFQALNSSIAFDYRLAPYDLNVSRAHARMLARCEIISSEDLESIERGLGQVENEIDENTFEIHSADEDIHMAVERRLTELIGPVGGKLHTARSRNDQVATDLAMFVRAHALEARAQLEDLLRVLAEQAAAHLDWPMPGYTHLQRAQPVYLSHHLLSYFWKFRRDHRRFDHCLEATDTLPLGSGALAGVNFETDRELLASELGFAQVSENSIDAVSSRDFVLDYLAAASTCATHLSQLGAELVLWSSEEFSFCELSDAFTSTSSIMPHKKNPDGAELLRAKGPRVAAHLSALHAVLHGLPQTYNKDLQEDKEHLFDAVDTLELCLAAATGMLEQISFNPGPMANAAGDELLAATDLADLLAGRGVPFRQSHGIVANLVRYAIDHKKSLSELTSDEVSEIAPGLGGDLFELLREDGWLESKTSKGGTALARIREQLDQANRTLGDLTT